MHHRSLSSAVLVAIAFTSAIGFTTTAAHADVVFLSSGGKVRGEIVKETSREVVIRTLSGTTVVPRDDIESIERGESAEEQYRKRLKKIDKSDPEAHYTLALWLKSIRAPTLARKELKRTLELDPDHRFAREEMGFARIKGEWVKTSGQLASAGRVTVRKRRRKAAKLPVPASEALNEALAGLRSKKAEKRAAGWAIVGDAAGETDRLLALISGGEARGSARVRSAVFAATPEADALEGDDLRPAVAHYVDTVQGPALTEALESYSRAVLRKHARVVKKLSGLLKDYKPGREGSALDKRTEALAKWVKTRDAALAVIFDKTIYPDANHGRSGQPIVDEHVDAVRPAWAKFDALVAKDVSKLLGMSQADAKGLLGALTLENIRLAEVRKALTARGGAEVPQPPIAPVSWVLVAYRGGEIQMALASAGQLNVYERELLRRLRDERVLAYNRTFKGKNPLSYGTVPTSLEVEQIRITDEYRIMMGRVALEVDPRLVQSARGHSSDMTRMGFFAHTSPVPGKRSMSNRMAQAGYVGGGGENISLGSTSPQATHNAWYNSSGHHRNILSEGYQCMGSGKNGKHWTQNFGMQGSLPR